MVPSVEQRPAEEHPLLLTAGDAPCENVPANPVIRRQERGLLIVAILAGVSTAGAFVLGQALRPSVAAADRVQSTPAIPPPTIIPSKPSAFGTAINATILPDVKLSADQVAKVGDRAVVVVTGYDAGNEPVTRGIGYVYSFSGIIVTTFEAIRGASYATVATSAGEQLKVTGIMGYNPRMDLVLLAVPEGNLPALETGAGEAVHAGEQLAVLGPENAVSSAVAGPRRAIGGVDLIEIAGEGAAGSPVLNERAKVVGVITQRVFRNENMTFAIPARYISQLLGQHRVLSFEDMLAETQSSVEPTAKNDSSNTPLK
jgi:hypothetical protein